MIVRAPQQAARNTYDVIVIGGGILGCCHALEAAKRGLSVLLLERDDFGGATSWSSHRIIHGGLRYVQSLDFPRQLESIRERRWFLENFPRFVRPLPCLMPLYNRGLKRMSTLRAALWINDALSAHRNNGLPESHYIPPGRMLSPAEVRDWFPGVVNAGLKGGALWHDAILVPPQRVLIEILRWAANGGAVALNYMRAIEVARASADSYVVHARDSVANCACEFRATDVINCAGPWAAQLQSGNAQGPAMSLAFSLVLNRPAVAKAAVAVSPGQRGHPMYFVVPYQGKMLAGTAHLPCPPGKEKSCPTEEQISTFLKELNESLPGLEASIDHVLRVFSGLLPATAPDTGDTLNRPVLQSHPSSTPKSRFLTVWAVKYTTARAVAEQVMQRFFPRLSVRPIQQPAPWEEIDLAVWNPPAHGSEPVFGEIVRRIEREESVVHIDDLLLRRTDWGTLPDSCSAAREAVAPWLNARAASGPGVSTVS
ncbi:MAG TPA: FAD-dependent oxidoreductase [Verrucomicrobiota bacterium]|nr:FAD-dependent oxidoreductase [Verrucomicrobiota bacterium]